MTGPSSERTDALLFGALGLCLGWMVARWASWPTVATFDREMTKLRDDFAAERERIRAAVPRPDAEGETR